MQFRIPVKKIIWDEAQQVFQDKNVDCFDITEPYKERLNAALLRCITAIFTRAEKSFTLSEMTSSKQDRRMHCRECFWCMPDHARFSGEVRPLWWAHTRHWIARALTWPIDIDNQMNGFFNAQHWWRRSSLTTSEDHDKEELVAPCLFQNRVGKIFFRIWTPDRMLLTVLLCFYDTTALIINYQFFINWYIINAVQTWCLPRSLWEFAVCRRLYMRADGMAVYVHPTNDICTPAPLRNRQVTHGRPFQLRHKLHSIHSHCRS